MLKKIENWICTQSFGLLREMPKMSLSKSLEQAFVLSKKRFATIASKPEL